MSVIDATPASRGSQRKKKPDQMLSSVVRETTPGPAVELLRQSPSFQLPRGDAWVVLLLRVSEIGGLSRAESRSEAKGSLVQLIAADTIATLATAEMLHEEVLGFILTEKTLERAGEFSMLTDATYSWGIAYQSSPTDLKVAMIGEHSLPDFVEDEAQMPRKFAQAQAIAAGNLSLHAVLGDETWISNGGSVDDTGEHDGVAAEHQAAPSPAETFPDDDPFGDVEEEFGDVEEDDVSSFDDVPVYDDVPSFDDLPGEEFSEPVSSSYDEERDESEEDEAIAEEQAQLGEEPSFDAPGVGGVEEYSSPGFDSGPPVADTTQIRSTLARRFVRQDLDISVDLAEFETSFGIHIPEVKIDLPDEASEWLADQIAQLTRNANAQLAKLHADGEARLRTKYVDLMSMHVETVLRDVSPDKQGSVYQQLTEAEAKEYSAARSDKDEVIRLRKADLAKEFDVAAREAGEAAARHTEAQYRERNKPRLTRQQADVVAEVEAEIQSNHDKNQRDIFELRRRDADRKMAIGQTAIFKVLSEDQEAQLARERELLAQLTDEIRQYLDENRKQDLSRTEVLAEDLATRDRIAELEAAHEDALHRIHEDAQRRQEEATAEFERQIVVLNSAWQGRLELSEARTEDADLRLETVTTQFSSLSKTFDEQYRGQLMELQQMKSQDLHQWELRDRQQKRMSRLFWTLGGAIGVVMLGAGIAGGIAIGLSIP